MSLLGKYTRETREQISKKQLKYNDYKMPAVTKRTQDGSISLKKGIVISTILHPSVMAILWLIITVLALFGIHLALFDKPKPKVNDIEFVLVDKVQEQINNGIETEIKQEDIRGNQVKVKGKTYDDFNVINNSLDRPVSTLNCRHYKFSIIVGVSKPEYTEEQLEEDKKKNLDGFEFEGKHYTNYEGEQLLRKIELELRKSKDIQILGRVSNNAQLVGEAQSRITQLTSKYHEVLKASGLKSKLNRAKVNNYRRINVKNMK